MSIKQKIAITIGAIAIIASILFPTWSIQINDFELYTKRMFIYSDDIAVVKKFALETELKTMKKLPIVEPDYSRMIAEIAIIITIIVVLVLLINKTDLKKYKIK